MTSSPRHERKPRPGLRERKKQATRDALAIAATRLALRHGLADLRVEDIAAAATSRCGPSTTTSLVSGKRSRLDMRRMRYAATALVANPVETPLWERLPRLFCRHGLLATTALGAGRGVDGGVADDVRDPELQGEILRKA